LFGRVAPLPRRLATPEPVATTRNALTGHALRGEDAAVGLLGVDMFPEDGSDDAELASELTL
jgi:hypothetical protein